MENIDVAVCCILFLPRLSSSINKPSAVANTALPFVFQSWVNNLCIDQTSISTVLFGNVFFSVYFNSFRKITSHKVAEWRLLNGRVLKRINCRRLSDLNPVFGQLTWNQVGVKFVVCFNYRERGLLKLISNVCLYVHVYVCICRYEWRKLTPRFLLDLLLCLLVMELFKNLMSSFEVSGEVHIWKRFRKKWSVSSSTKCVYLLKCKLIFSLFCVVVYLPLCTDRIVRNKIIPHMWSLEFSL